MTYIQWLTNTTGHLRLNRDYSEAPMWVAKAVTVLCHIWTFLSAQSCFLPLLSTGVDPKGSETSCMLNSTSELLPQPVMVHGSQIARVIPVPPSVTRTLPYSEHSLSSHCLRRLYNGSGDPTGSGPHFHPHFIFSHSRPAHSAPAIPASSNMSGTLPSWDTLAVCSFCLQDSSPRAEVNNFL